MPGASIAAPAVLFCAHTTAQLHSSNTPTNHRLCLFMVQAIVLAETVQQGTLRCMQHDIGTRIGKLLLQYTQKRINNPLFTH